MISGTDKQTGTIKFYKPEKGYGMIVPNSPGEDIFFHITQFIKGTDLELIAQGVHVKFYLIKKGKRYQATRTEILVEE